MGKYASKYRQWFIGDRTKDGGERIGEEADAEIAQLQREKAELEKFCDTTCKKLQICMDDYVVLRRERDDLIHKVADLEQECCGHVEAANRLHAEHTTLVERVKVHNKSIIETIELNNNPSTPKWVNEVLSKNLISLD